MPPKTVEESADLAASLEDIQPLQPSFVSVTYRGGRESRQRTYDLVNQIERDGYVTAMAHVICVGHTRAEMRDLLKNYTDAGVVNIMALGGDRPNDAFGAASEFDYAIDLVELTREIGDFSIGVAAHPNGHPRSPDRRSDRRFLAEKLAMADFAVTQFFFESSDWTRLVEELAELGVDQAGPPGDHAGHHDLGYRAHAGHGWPRARFPRATSHCGPSTRWCDRGTRRRNPCRDHAVSGVDRGERTRSALLHAQSFDHHERDLSRAVLVVFATTTRREPKKGPREFAVGWLHG